MGQSAAGTVNLQARKQQLVRGAIWDAAIDLFYENGYDRTAIDEIAESAGVSRRTFFRYYASKDDLMGQMVVSFGQMLAEAVAACPRSCTHMETVRRTVLSVGDYVVSQSKTLKVIRLAEKDASARKAQMARWAEVQDRVAEAFAVRCRTRSREETAPRMLAALTVAILDSCIEGWARKGHEIPAQVEKAFVALGRLVCEGGTGR